MNCSDWPVPLVDVTLYSLVVSMKVTPASRAAEMILVASSRSHWLPKKSVPKLLVPSPTTETSSDPRKRVFTSAPFALAAT